MSSHRLSDALARLSASIARLQAAAERRTGADATLAERDEEFALLQDDRNRLAAELDAALHRGERLLAAQDEVSRRLDRAGRVVEDVLHGLAHGAPPRAQPVHAEEGR